MPSAALYEQTSTAGDASASAQPAPLITASFPSSIVTCPREGGNIPPLSCIGEENALRWITTSP